MLDPSKWTGDQHTKAFLMLMGGLNAKQHFRTFPDGDTQFVTSLTRSFTGEFLEHAQVLRQFNQRGAGVFAVINAGGHKDADINSVTAVFADTDGAPLEPIIQALPPHCVVNTSPGKYHVYWCVAGFPLDQFKLTQTHIAKKFDCDPSVSNLARVMRLPGFRHQKADPFDVRIVHIDPQMQKYSHADIIKAFGINTPPQNEKLQVKDRPLGTSLLRSLKSNPYSLTDVERMLRFIDPWERNIWRDVIFALVHEYGEGSRDLAVRWSRGELSASRGRA